MAGQQYFLETSIPARSISVVNLLGLRWLDARSGREVVGQVRIAISVVLSLVCERISAVEATDGLCSGTGNVEQL